MSKVSMLIIIFYKMPSIEVNNHSSWQGFYSLQPVCVHLIISTTALFGTH